MEKIKNQYDAISESLVADCKNCSGLCCVALCFARSEGFPADKAVGEPCRQMQDDFKCAIHSNLKALDMRGCMAYDCLGAGQKVTKNIYKGENWQSTPKIAEQMFEVFLIVYYLHQMLWYLIEAVELNIPEKLKLNIDALVEENQQMTASIPEKLMNLDIDGYSIRVNSVLKKACEIISAKGKYLGGKSCDYIGKDFKKSKLDGRDLSMSLLIASNLEGCSLCGTIFLGADMRDTRIKDTDLSKSVFLTQLQINSAIGNSNTKLPKRLTRPTAWD